MRTIAIMQPYFFPYPGYFLLASQADVFVFLDDVNYINRGWINRNRIMRNGQPEYISVPLKKASQNRLICNTELFDFASNRKKIIEKIENSYKSAPFFSSALPLLSEVMAEGTRTISELAISSVTSTLSQLGLHTTFKRSSTDFQQSASLSGQDRIIDIVLQENAARYINLPGGTALYSRERFQDHGIDIQFLAKMDWVFYHGGDSAIPNLSILDALMWNPPDVISRALTSLSPKRMYQ